MGFTWPVYILMGLAVSSKKYVDDLNASGAALETRYPEYAVSDYFNVTAPQGDPIDTPIGTLYRNPKR